MAELKLNSTFSDHMVLQRNQRIPVWGTASPGAEVRVSVAGKEGRATADAHGKWRAILEPMSEGTSLTMNVESGADKLSFKDVAVGEVWLCSGQSNMQWTVKDSENSAKELSSAAKYPNIRIYAVPKSGANSPADTMKANWQPCTTATVASFSAVAYFFGRELQDADPSIPVGLIDSSFGGTTAEAWITSEVLTRDFAGEPLEDSMFGFKPANMYNAMIAPLVPYPLAGVLWYQGESNAGRPAQYTRLLTALIANWREKWQNPKLPFLIVQLPNYAEKFFGLHYTWLREAQAKVTATVPHTGLAVSIDTSDGFNLHPPQKREISHRLALMARHMVRGEDVVSSGPTYKRSSIEGNTARVQFDNVAGGLADRDGGELRGFALAGDNGEFRYAKAHIVSPDTVELQCDPVPQPKYIRYAWEGNPQTDLCNKEGLPAVPFRTDTLPVKDLEIDKLPTPRTVKTSHYDITVLGDGCVSSLMLNGKELLAPGAPGAGGCAFMTIWGPRRMFTVDQAGPDVISLEDDVAAITYRFEEDQIRWELRNKSREKLPFQIMLGPETSATLADRTASLSRGAAVLEITGIDSITQQPGAPQRAEALLGPEETRTLAVRPKQ